jgi:hypothetical protein
MKEEVDSIVERGCIVVEGRLLGRAMVLSALWLSWARISCWEELFGNGTLVSRRY